MITVAHVLALPGLGLETVVEGDPGVPVSWVVTSELADPTPHLDGGEIVLLTGVNRAVQRSSWRGYVRRLADKGVVGLGMGVGDHFSYSEVPEDLAHACRDAGLTLFSVPERTPFLGIIRATADMRTAQERTALEVMLSQQRTLTKAALGADGPAQVVQTLAALLEDSWVGVCTADAVLVERSGPLPALPSDRALVELVARLRPAGLRGSLSESGPRGSVVIHPLGVQGNPQSYLVTVLPLPVERTQVGVITTAVALLSLHAERTVERTLFRRRIHAGALALVLGGDVRSADALLAVVGDRGWTSTSHPVRVARLRGSPDRIQEAVRRLEAHTSRTPRPPLVGLPATDSSPGGEGVAVLVEDLPEQLAALRSAVELSGLRAGIGGRAAVPDSGTSEQQAVEALERTSAHRRIGVWDEVVSGGLAGLLPPETARAYARDLLRPIRELEDGERLLAVLQTFLTHNGNRRQTAAELGIHRNTLQQRLQLIEQTLGRSLEDPQARAELWLALHVAAG